MTPPRRPSAPALTEPTKRGKPTPDAGASAKTRRVVSHRAPEETVAAGPRDPKGSSGSAVRAAIKESSRDAVRQIRGRNKVRKTLRLDPELVAAFSDTEGGLSAAVNAALRDQLARTGRRQALAARVAELEAEFGAADPAEVERFARHGVPVRIVSPAANSGSGRAV